MCKFNNHLFTCVLLLVLLMNVANCSPKNRLSSEKKLAKIGDDLDIIYDERQNGTDNIRVRAKDVMIRIPAPSNPQSGLVNFLLTNLAISGDFKKKYQPNETDEVQFTLSDQEGDGVVKSSNSVKVMGDEGYDRPYDYYYHQRQFEPSRDDRIHLGPEHSKYNATGYF